MESLQKSPWGQDHPAWPARAHSASVLLLGWLPPVKSFLVFGCFTWEGWMRFRSSCQGLFRDASGWSPSFPLRMLLGEGGWRTEGKGVETVEGLLAACKSPPLTIVRIDHQCGKYPNWVFTCVTGEINSVLSQD